MSAFPQPEHSPFVPFVDPDLLRIAKAALSDFADRVVPVEERTIVRQTYPLRRFYNEWMLPVRLARVEAGKLARGSLSKDRQSLNRWESLTRPTAGEWPPAKPWQGIPLGYITDAYLDDFCDKLRSGYAAATAYSTWTHLRTMFNAAAKLKALEVAPAPKEPPQLGKDQTEMYAVHVGPDAELSRAYAALAENPLLQSAFVMSVNAGPRPIDLFLLKWSNFDLVGDRPFVDFKSRKSKKDQRLPLAPCTVSHIDRLKKLASGELVFPGLSNPRSADPEKSREARRRNAVTKVLLKKAGINVVKPWQAGRACCNERYESHREGVGQFLLGHAKTLNAKSYRRPSHLIFEAVNTLPQPACFL